ncbi:hypothetical protein DENSPDRAFT_886440 [Dentipellis sp. KUC8613]|nr:hypothetical protein DENSPDRAFT_886440 [Dentipellis sp. KUC8613]
MLRGKEDGGCDSLGADRYAQAEQQGLSISTASQHSYTETRQEQRLTYITTSRRRADAALRAAPRTPSASAAASDPHAKTKTPTSKDHPSTAVGRSPRGRNPKFLDDAWALIFIFRCVLVTASVHGNKRGRQDGALCVEISGRADAALRAAPRAPSSYAGGKPQGQMSTSKDHPSFSRRPLAAGPKSENSGRRMGA